MTSLPALKGGFFVNVVLFFYQPTVTIVGLFF